MATIRVTRWVGLLAAMMLLLATWSLRIQWLQEKSLEAKLAVVASLPMPMIGRPNSGPLMDFTSRLPDYADVAPLVAELQLVGAASGVVLQEVQSHSSPATEQQLAQTELNVQLRGTYPAIKAVLREVQARYPHTTVRRLALRRNATAQDIQADVALVLWARPAPSLAHPTPGAVSRGAP
jgi:hypothetical protein